MQIPIHSTFFIQAASARAFSRLADWMYRSSSSCSASRERNWRSISWNKQMKLKNSSSLTTQEQTCKQTQQIHSFFSIVLSKTFVSQQPSSTLMSQLRVMALCHSLMATFCQSVPTYDLWSRSTTHLTLTANMPNLAVGKFNVALHKGALSGCITLPQCALTHQEKYVCTSSYPRCITGNEASQLILQISAKSFT